MERQKSQILNNLIIRESYHMTHMIMTKRLFLYSHYHHEMVGHQLVKKVQVLMNHKLG